MYNGQIVQSGTAEDIYTEPARVSVVKFIGNYNLLTPEQARLTLGLTTQSRIAIRPESIYVKESGRHYGAGIGHEVTGQVKDHILLGNVIRYKVCVADVELLVDLLNRSSERLFPIGSKLQLLFNTHEIREVLDT